MCLKIEELPEMTVISSIRRSQFILTVQKL